MFKSKSKVYLYFQIVSKNPIKQLLKNNFFPYPTGLYEDCTMCETEMLKG